jgi:hypothetical protein
MEAKKRNLIIIIMIVLVVVIAIVVIRKNKQNDTDTLIVDDAEIETISYDDRKNNAIESSIQKLSNAGLNVIKQSEISVDNIEGYKIQVDGKNLEIYYLERNKLAGIIKTGSINGEAELTLNGKTQKALTYGNVFILNCEDETIKEKINSALTIR